MIDGIGLEGKEFEPYQDALSRLFWGLFRAPEHAGKIVYGLPLALKQHNSSHDIYTIQVERMIEDIRAAKPELTAKQILERIRDRTKILIKSKPETKLNEIFPSFFEAVPKK